MKIIEYISSLKIDSFREFNFIYNIIFFSLLLTAICGIIIPIIIKNQTYLILGSYISIPFLFGIIAFKMLYDKKSEIIEMPKILFKFFLTIYLILFTISIIILYINDVRPYIYYVIISLIMLIIVLQILFFNISKTRSLLIIAQIAILFLNIIFGVSLNYYQFIGRTDPIGHAYVIDYLIKNGYVNYVFGDYQPYPMWHILVSSLYHILGVNIPSHKIMFFANGLIYSIIILIMYIVSLRIFNDSRQSLICSIFIIFSPYLLFYGMSSIARSPESFFEILICMLLLYNNKNYKINFLLVFIGVTIVLYHSVSMIFILLILILISITNLILRSKKNQYIVSNNYLLLLFIVFFVYLCFQAQDTFRAIVENLVREPTSKILTKAILITPWTELYNYLQYALLLFFFTIGILWTTKSPRIPYVAKVFSIAAILPSIFTFPGPSLLFSKFSSDFSLSRFGEYSFIFIAIICGVGFYKVFLKSHKNKKAIPILLFIALCFLTLSNDFNSSDNPLIKRPFYTFYLTNEETIAFNRAARISEGLLLSDYVTQRYLMKSFNESSNILEVDYKNYTFITNSPKDSILIRSGELCDRPLKLYSLENSRFKLRPSWRYNLDYYYKDYPVWNTLSGYNRIYQSGNVDVYIGLN